MGDGEWEIQNNRSTKKGKFVFDRKSCQKQCPNYCVSSFFVQGAVGGGAGHLKIAPQTR